MPSPVYEWPVQFRDACQFCPAEPSASHELSQHALLLERDRVVAPASNWNTSGAVERRERDILLGSFGYTCDPSSQVCRMTVNVSELGERKNWLRSCDDLAAEYTGIQLVARRTAAEACFIDIEACTLRIFDAIRRPFAIGHNGSDLDRVLHLRFEVAARRAVIPNYMHFLSQLEIWVGHRKIYLPTGPSNISHNGRKMLKRASGRAWCARWYALDAPNTGGNRSPR